MGGGCRHTDLMMRVPPVAQANHTTTVPGGAADVARTARGLTGDLGPITNVATRGNLTRALPLLTWGVTVAGPLSLGPLSFEFRASAVVVLKWWPLPLLSKWRAGGVVVVGQDAEPTSSWVIADVASREGAGSTTEDARSDTTSETRAVGLSTTLGWDLDGATANSTAGTTTAATQDDGV